MSEALSVTKRTVERDLSAMSKLIRREGSDKTGMWLVLDESL